MTEPYEVVFCPINSGSNGNCTYIASQSTGILIDAGLSGRNIETRLKQIHADARDISALFITHEHSDHISGVGVMSRRYKLPVYATPNTWRYLNRHQPIGKIDEALKREILPGQTICVGDMDITAFDIPHDSSQPVGYSVCVGSDENGKKLCVATDIGHVTDEIRTQLSGADVMLIESNHDVEMLLNGRYPQALKDRVMGKRGHLSNEMAGALLSQTYSERLKHVYLGHLSEENNIPMIAMDTVRNILDIHNIPLRSLRIADRYGVSEAVRI